VNILQEEPTNIIKVIKPDQNSNHTFFEHTGELVASYNLWKRFLCGFLLGKKLWVQLVEASKQTLQSIKSNHKVVEISTVANFNYLQLVLNFLHRFYSCLG
jgi:hypothetical protein